MNGGGLLLAIDTATATAVVALGDADGRLRSADTWGAGQRHSEELLPRIERLLAAQGVTPKALTGIVVGTGPGAFTGLRVGLATAKTLAHQLAIPVAGVSTAEAILAAAIAEADRSLTGRAGQSDGDVERPSSGRAGLPAAVLLLPAGSSDRILVRQGMPAELLPGGREADVPPGTIIVAVDLSGRAAADALERGALAQAALPAMLVGIGAARLASGQTDDVERLVPDYVTLPRGVAAAAGEIEWSRDHR